MKKEKKTDKGIEIRVVSFRIGLDPLSFGIKLIRTIDGTGSRVLSLPEVRMSEEAVSAVNRLFDEYDLYVDVNNKKSIMEKLNEPS